MHLVTGSTGYVGSVIVNKLINSNLNVIAIDKSISKVNSKYINNNIELDITNFKELEEVFKKHKNIECIYHCAAQLNFNKRNKNYFQKVNVESTEVLSNLAIKYGVRNFIYISSNCVYGKLNSLDISEDYPTNPFEEYGQSKLESENILLSKKSKLNIIIFRPPTIIGEGRLGILSVVFDFIKDSKKLFLVGNGTNRYQFVYGDDLATACIAASSYDKTNIFNIGTSKPSSLRDAFEYLIKKSGSKSKIYCLPDKIILPLMKFFFKLGLSPLGPYQYNMIVNSFSGETDRIRKELNWEPSKDNNEMLLSAYNYYVDNYDEIRANSIKGSGNRNIGREGIIKILKWLS
tara:strand:+ start:3978 stop:5018 length:1041 start_codon:yes stop_codon:yes gene_type:complete